MNKSTNSKLKTLKLESNSYNKLGHYTKAMKSLMKALELNPKSNSLKHDLANILYKQKNYDKSLKLLLELSTTIKSRQILFKDIAMCHYKMNNLEKALESIQLSLADNPDKVSSLYAQGLI